MQDNNNKQANALAKEQLKQLFEHLPATNAAVVLIGVFVVWILWSVTADYLLLGWYAYVLFIAVLRSMLATQYKHASLNQLSIRFWLTAYKAGIVASGIGWGATLILLVPADLIIYVIMMVFILCGLVTGAAASLSSLQMGFTLFAVPALLPGIVYLALIDAPYTRFISVCMFIFLVFITLVALRIHKTILYSINQQVEIARKMVEVEKEKEKLQEKCEQLESDLLSANKQLLRVKEHYHDDMLTNVSLLQKQEEEFHEQKLKQVVDRFDGGMWDWNIKRDRISYSPGWLDMLGYAGESVQQNFDFWSSLLHPFEQTEVLNQLHQYIDGKQDSFVSTHRMKSSTGEWNWVSSRCVVLAWGTNGVPLNVVGYDIKIADSDDEFAHMLHMSTLDEASLIATVENFRRQLKRILNTTRDSELEHVMCHIHVDLSNANEKITNSYADQLSQQVLRLLLKKCRNRDTLVNFGELNFGLIMEHCALEVAWRKIKNLSKILKEYNFNCDGEPLHLDISIGLTPVRASTASVEQILDDANRAALIARKMSVEQIYLYQSNDDGYIQNLVEKDIVSQIQAALELDHFQIISTPIQQVSNQSRSRDEFFCLKTRLLNDKEFDLFDIDMEDVIKRHGPAESIYRKFMQALFKWLNKQPKKYDDSKRTYFVGLSDSIVTDASVIDYLKQQLNTNKDAAGSLCFMINEHVAINQYDELLYFIEQVKDFGCKFALDDIGVDSLVRENIKSLEVDYVKIDNDLVRTLESSPESLSSIKYINEISHILNIETIVEHVHKESLLDSLRDIGVDYVAGRGVV